MEEKQSLADEWKVKPLSTRLEDELRKTHSYLPPYCGWIQHSTISDLPRQIAILERALLLSCKDVEVVENFRRDMGAGTSPFEWIEDATEQIDFEGKHGW
jgi:hypothetical protein